MKKKPMVCRICGSKKTKEVIDNYSIKLPKIKFIIARLKTIFCSNCGESILDKESTIKYNKATIKFRKIIRRLNLRLA